MSENSAEQRRAPICMTRLRPNRSESPPPAKSSAAKGNE